MTAAWLVVWSSVACTSIAAAEAPPVVNAGGEALVGEWLTPGEAVFRGIPYAAAPVGDLRWRPPAPHEPRPGRQSARAFGPACIQDDRLVSWERAIATGFGRVRRFAPAPMETSEDCLSLNVWTTSLAAKSPVPVMVWIHGGSNVNGTGSSPWHDGRALAREGAVVVTLNYRLGIFGFLAHPALSAESPHHVSGNYGMLDQLEALRWVKANIRAFGGDPERVTVFGESAGAIDVMALVASPMSGGLFQRAIIQSGVSYVVKGPLAVAEKQGVALAEAAKADTAAALRRLSAADLLELQKTRLAESGMAFGPVVDGWLLPEAPGRAFTEGRSRKVPILAGSNAREMTSLAGLLPPDGHTLAGYRRWIGQSTGRAAPRVEQLYPAASDAEAWSALVDASTDFAFTCSARLAARGAAAAGAPAFLYQFTRVLPGGEALGAYHGMEVGYVFGVRMSYLDYEPVDDALGAAMRRYWVAFAATGRPSVAGLPEWPTHDAASGRYLELGATIQAKSGLRAEACGLFDRIYPFLWGGAKPE